GFGDGAMFEELLVRTAYSFGCGQQQHAGGLAVQAVCGSELRQTELRAKPYQNRLANVATPGDRGQKVWFVDHHDPLVAIENPYRVRDLGLLRQVPVEPDEDV